MKKYKNVLLLIIAFCLFIYAGFISVFPVVYTSTFNKEAFEQKFLPATGFNITFDDLKVRIQPNFVTVINVNNIDIQYPDKQPLFKAKHAVLTTTPSAILTGKFVIKSLYLRTVKYDDMILPSGENKLAFFPQAFTPSYLGKKKITIVPGPVAVNNLDISYTISEPYKYTTDFQREAVYSEEQVREFLSFLNIKDVVIK